MVACDPCETAHATVLASPPRSHTWQRKRTITYG